MSEKHIVREDHRMDLAVLRQHGLGPIADRYERAIRANYEANAHPAKVEDGAAKKRPNLRPSDETVRFVAECFKHDPAPTALDEFNRGVLYASAWLVLAYGDDVMAARMVRDAGLNGTDCSEMDDYDKDGLRKIAEQCRLRGLSAAQAKEGK